jgi:hypothetical protein
MKRLGTGGRVESTNALHSNKKHRSSLHAIGVKHHELKIHRARNA